jgi:hypothetical protein
MKETSMLVHSNAMRTHLAVFRLLFQNGIVQSACCGSIPITLGNFSLLTRPKFMLEARSNVHVKLMRKKCAFGCKVFGN